MSPTHTVYSAASQVLPLAKDLDENKVTPGVLGFIVFAVLGGAVWMLMKSMNKQMGKVDFEEEPEDAAADGTDGGAESAEHSSDGKPSPPAARS